MEKIVVMTGGSDHDSNLIECLRALFPECEIDIQHKASRNNDPADVAQDDDVKIDENMDKYLSFL